MNWASKYYANDKTPYNDDKYGLIESQFSTDGNKNIVKKLFDKIVVGDYKIEGGKRRWTGSDLSKQAYKQLEQIHTSKEQEQKSQQETNTQLNDEVVTLKSQQ